MTLRAQSAFWVNLVHTIPVADCLCDDLSWWSWWGSLWSWFVDARLMARFNADLYTPCHARYSMSQSRNIIFSKYSSSHLQPGALICIESHYCVSFSHLDRNSAIGLALSLHAASDADLWMQGSLLASIQTCPPPAMPGTACHNHNFILFLKYSSSRLQPGALTCIESHDCVSFSHLDRNSATGLALYLHITSDADLWMHGSLLASMQTLTPPAMPGTAWNNHENCDFSKVQLITSAARYTDLHRVPWFCIISAPWLQQYHWSNCCLYTQHLMWMQGPSLASMQTFKHPARPDAALTIYKSLIFKGQLNTSVNNCTAVIDICRVSLLSITFTAWMQWCLV